MVSTHLNKCLLVIIMLMKCCESTNETAWGQNITKLYELFRSAVKDDVYTPKIIRRVFVNNSEYQIHINKLKKVNGFKLHNIMIKRINPDANSTIYINNPLEARLPHPFMTLEEFKNALMEQRLKDREAFKKSLLLAAYNKKKGLKNVTTTKFKFTHNEKTINNTHKKGMTATKQISTPKVNTRNISAKKKEQTTEKVNKKITIQDFLRKNKTATAVKNHSNTRKTLNQNITLSSVQTSTFHSIKLMSYDPIFKLKNDNHKTTRDIESSKKEQLSINKQISTNLSLSSSTKREEGISLTDNITSILRAKADVTEANIEVSEAESVTNIVFESDNFTTRESSGTKQAKSKNIYGNNDTDHNKETENPNDLTSTTIKETTIVDKATTTSKEEQSSVEVQESIHTDVVESTEVETMTIDEEQPSVEIKDSIDIEEEETIADADVTEETTTETSTTTTTHPTTTTVRVKWSRPRVFVGAPPTTEQPSQ